MHYAFDVDVIPEGNGGCDQGEPAGAIALLLEAAVADLALAADVAAATK